MTFDDIYKYSVYANVYSYITKKSELKRDIARKNSALNFYALEVADDAEELHNVIMHAYNNSPNSYKYSDLINSTKLIPLYAFYRVIAQQNFISSKNQSKVIDTYCKVMNIDYSSSDLCHNVKKQTDLVNKVGFTRTTSGEIWNSYFKLIYENKTVYHSVNTIAKLYSSIVVNFALIGEYDNVDVSTECSDFTSFLCDYSNKMESQYKYVPEDINLINIHTHRNTLINEINSIQIYDKESSMDWVELFEYYISSILRDLVLPIIDYNKKITVLNTALSLCNISVISNVSVLISCTDYDTNNILNTLHDHYLVMITGLYQKAGRGNDCVEFAETLLNMLECVEKEVISRTSIKEINGIIKKIMSKQIGFVITALENGY